MVPLPPHDSYARGVAPPYLCLVPTRSTRLLYHLHIICRCSLLSHNPCQLWPFPRRPFLPLRRPHHNFHSNILPPEHMLSLPPPRQSVPISHAYLFPQYLLLLISLQNSQGILLLPPRPIILQYLLLPFLPVHIKPPLPRKCRIRITPTRLTSRIFRPTRLEKPIPFHAQSNPFSLTYVFAETSFASYRPLIPNVLLRSFQITVSILHLPSHFVSRPLH